MQVIRLRGETRRGTNGCGLKLGQAEGRSCQLLSMPKVVEFKNVRRQMSRQTKTSPLDGVRTMARMANLAGLAAFSDVIVHPRVQPWPHGIHGQPNPIEIAWSTW